MQDYPAALESFKAALAESQEAKQQVDFELMNSADMLWRLGRYAEAEQMLNEISPSAQQQPDLTFDVQRIRSQIFLSKKQYKQALLFARNAETIARTLSLSDLSEIQDVVAQIETNLGEFQQAQVLCRQSSASIRAQSDPVNLAILNFTQARLLFKLNDLWEAKPLAEAAENFFRQSGQREYEWQSLLLLSEIELGAGNPAASKDLALRSLNSLAQLKLEWGTSAFETYLRRPDLESINKQLTLLSGAKKS